MDNCLGRQTSLLHLVQAPWNFQFHQFLIALKSFTLLKLISGATKMRQIATIDIFQKVILILSTN